MDTATDDLELLLGVLPPDLQEHLEHETQRDSDGELMEIIMDLGRRAEARLIGPGGEERRISLGQYAVERGELAHVLDRVGEFTADNRAGIERTLHRISAMRNRQ